MGNSELRTRRALIAAGGVAGLGAVAFAVGRMSGSSSAPSEIGAEPLREAVMSPTTEPQVTSKFLEIQPTRENPPTPEPKRGFAWDMETQTNLLPTLEYLQSVATRGAAPSHVWSGEKLFVRNKEGRVQEIGLLEKAGSPDVRQEWNGGDAVIMGANQNMLVVLSLENFNLSVLNPSTFERQGRVSFSDIRDMRSAQALRWPVMFSQEKFALTFAAGFRVYDKFGNTAYDYTANYETPVALSDNIVASRAGLQQQNLFVHDLRTRERLVELSDVVAATSDGQRLYTAQSWGEKQAMVRSYDMVTGRELWGNVVSFENYVSSFNGWQRLYPLPSIDMVAFENGAPNWEAGKMDFESVIFSKDNGDIDSQYLPGYPQFFVGGDSQRKIAYFFNMDVNNTWAGNLREPVFWGSDIQAFDYLGRIDNLVAFGNWNMADERVKQLRLDPRIYFLDESKNGERVWSVDLGIASLSGWQTVVKNGVIIAAGGQEILHIDPKHQRVDTWMKFNGLPSNTAVTDAGDLVLVETYQNPRLSSKNPGRLYAIRP